MSLKIISICLFAGMSGVAWSQSEIRIIKRCTSSAQGGFVGKTYVCQKFFYKNSELTGEVNYSYNGWQIYDSVSYENNGSTICKKIFSPLYRDGEAVVLKYEIKKDACDERKLFSSQYLSTIDDRYFLLRPYLADLNLLLELKPIKSEDGFRFKDGIAPSILNKYGIPFNAVLKSFSISVSDDNLIAGDKFYFSDYSVERKYKYSNKTLQEVGVFVKNAKTDEVFDFRESFEVRR